MSLYTQFYTASDVTVSIVNRTTASKEINLDLLTGKGYRHNVTAMPVYGLGNQLPEFYSQGNSLVTGTLELSFKSGIYLTRALSAIGNYPENIALRTSLLAKDPNKLTDAEFKTLVQLTRMNALTIPSEQSILPYSDPCNLIIRFDNNNELNKESSGYLSTIMLVDVRFIEFVQGVSTSGDAVITDQYRFMAKTIVAQQSTTI